MKTRIKSSLSFDLIILFCGAAILRTVYVLIYGIGLKGDAVDYLDIAKNLAFNQAFAFTNSDGGLAYTALRPLLYPALIASLWTGDAPPLNSVAAF